jgi:hypothetical protein
VQGQAFRKNRPDIWEEQCKPQKELTKPAKNIPNKTQQTTTSRTRGNR